MPDQSPSIAQALLSHQACLRRVATAHAREYDDVDVTLSR